MQCTAMCSNEPKQAYEEACRTAWLALLDGRPEVRILLGEFDLEEEAAGPWFWAAHFDGPTAGRKLRSKCSRRGVGARWLCSLGKSLMGYIVSFMGVHVASFFRARLCR